MAGKNPATFTFPSHVAGYDLRHLLIRSNSIMQLATRLAAATLAMLIPFGAIADSDTDAIKAQLTKINPSLKIKSVTSSALPGIYEVFANGSILYVDKSAKYVLAGGKLIEDVSKRDLTAERLKELTAIKFDTLPFKDAIEIKKGNGAYRFAVFTDPDCPFCKSLEQGLKKLDMTDYTAYIFLMPLEELHPEAKEKAESIWCAKDRGAAWLEWMTDGKLPEKTTCENPVKAIAQLASDLDVMATPTIYLETGNKTSSPQELVDAIKQKNMKP
jgi:thiol:disulfide interchange protein DsbC